jgi:hypothetical protein
MKAGPGFILPGPPDLIREFIDQRNGHHNKDRRCDESN